MHPTSKQVSTSPDDHSSVQAATYLGTNSQHFASIIEFCDDAIVGKDLQGRVESWNPAAEKLYGYSRAEMIGKAMKLLLPPDRANEESEILRQIKAGQRVDHFETSRLTKNGMCVDVSLTISPIRDAKGKIVGASHIARNITQKVRLSRVSAQLAAIVESSEDAIIGKTLDGIVETWNRGAEKLYGYSAAEMERQSMSLLLPPDRPDEEQEILRRIRNGELVDHFETVRVNKLGKAVIVSLTVSPIRDSLGRVDGASHVARDITGQREFESRIQQMQKLESLGVLAGGVAHDFNNLLTGIIGNTSLALQHGPRAGPARVCLEDVMKAAERAAKLTSQLLAYAGKGRFVVEKINISELIQETSQLIEASIPRKVQVIFELEQTFPPVQGDSGKLQQVFINLIINAAEAIGEKNGTVIARSGLQVADEMYLQSMFTGCDVQPGQFVLVEVHDTGCGMDEATQAKIFDPFFTTKFTGRGLGLAAVQGIVRSHGGALKVYSKPGEGSTFKLLLPVLPGDMVPIDDPEIASAEPLRGQGHLLVVDDDELIGRFAQNTLLHYGYSVNMARSGLEALEIFSRTPDAFRLVLLDLTMPCMSGEETYRKLRKIRPHVSVLLTSGFSEQAAVRHFAGKGLVGFIQKPYTARQLAEKVKAALSL